MRGTLPTRIRAGTAPTVCAMPLRAIDRVLAVDEEGVVVAKVISGNEPYFPGHFPEFPLYPGVFIVEIIHQASLVFAAHRLGGEVGAHLAHVHSARFIAPVYPGDSLEARCRCTLDPDGATMQVHGRCACGLRPVAEVRLGYRLAQRR